jgi:hypothetical protein
MASRSGAEAIRSKGVKGVQAMTANGWQRELEYGWQGDRSSPEWWPRTEQTHAELAEQELADFVTTRYVRSSVQRELMVRQRAPLATASTGMGGQVG